MVARLHLPAVVTPAPVAVVIRVELVEVLEPVPERPSPCAPVAKAATCQVWLLAVERLELRPDKPAAPEQ